VFPDHTAIVHGALRRSYASFYARACQLGSALGQAGMGRGDTVSVMLANTPAMLECHHGVPMCGAVLHSINTRLDAAVIAFQLDHAMAAVVIVDREFLPLMQQVLALATVAPLVPSTPASATTPSPLEVPPRSSRPERTPSPGSPTAPGRSHATKPCAPQDASVGQSGYDGAAVTAEAASKPRCIVWNCWASASWPGASTVRWPSSRSAWPS
jgi:acyl-CoA synthetase (AMP-forming)/AMP-acid ligase II